VASRIAKGREGERGLNLELVIFSLGKVPGRKQGEGSEYEARFGTLIRFLTVMGKKTGHRHLDVVGIGSQEREKE